MRYISRDYVEQMLDDNKPLDLLTFAKTTAREAVTAHAKNIDKARFEQGADDESSTFEESIAEYHKWIAEQSDEILEDYVLPVHGIDDLIS